MAGRAYHSGRFSILGWISANSLWAFPTTTGYGTYDGVWTDGDSRISGLVGPVDVYGGHGVAVESVGRGLD